MAAPRELPLNSVILTQSLPAPAAWAAGRSSRGLWRPRAGRPDDLKTFCYWILFNLLTMLRIAASIAVLAASASAYVSTPALVGYEPEYAFEHFLLLVLNFSRKLSLNNLNQVHLL
jgi:hypothetical protein